MPQWMAGWIEAHGESRAVRVAGGRWRVASEGGEIHGRNAKKAHDSRAFGGCIPGDLVGKRRGSAVALRHGHASGRVTRHTLAGDGHIDAPGPGLPVLPAPQSPGPGIPSGGRTGVATLRNPFTPEFQVLNVLSSAGATILAIGYLLPLGYLTWLLFYGKRASANPWNATGLEWRTASPPPTENFEVTPVVTAPPYDYPSREVERRHV